MGKRLDTFVELRHHPIYGKPYSEVLRSEQEVEPGLCLYRWAIRQIMAREALSPADFKSWASGLFIEGATRETRALVFLLTSLVGLPQGKAKISEPKTEGAEPSQPKGSPMNNVKLATVYKNGGGDYEVYQTHRTKERAIDVAKRHSTAKRHLSVAQLDDEGKVVKVLPGETTKEVATPGGVNDPKGYGRQHPDSAAMKDTNELQRGNLGSGGPIPRPIDIRKRSELHQMADRLEALARSYRDLAVAKDKLDAQFVSATNAASETLSKAKEEGSK